MTDRITFASLVGTIAKESNVPPKIIHELLKETINVIDQGLLRDGRVSVAELGIFELKRQAARTGRNPQTGESIEIPEHNRVIFKPAANLRRFINRNNEGKKPLILEDQSEEAESFIQAKQTVPIHSASPETITLPKSGIQQEKPLETTTMPESNSGTGKPRKKKYQSIGILALLLMLILLGVFFLFQPQKKNNISKTKDIRSIPSEPAAIKKVRKKEILSVQPNENAMNTNTKADVDNSKKNDFIQVEKTSPITSPDLITDQHEIKSGDSLWTISLIKYSDPYLWPYIYRINTNTVQDPDTLEVGSTIQSPRLEGTAGDLSMNDKKYIADGYMQVYISYRKQGKIKARQYLWVAGQFNIPEIIKKYENKIHNSDRIYMSRAKGNPVIK